MTLEQTQKDLSLFQIQTLEKFNALIGETVDLNVRIKILEDAREVQIKLNTKFEKRTKLIELTDELLAEDTKPTLFERWFKRKK